MQVQRFDYKFRGMRKPDNFIVYPRNNDDPAVLVQGSRTIARVNTTTGKGIVNFKGSHAKYSAHLAHEMGAVQIDFPKDFVTKVCEYMPQSGDSLDSGGTIRLA